MLTTAPTYPTLGDRLAAKLKPAQRWRPRPRAKRPENRKPKPRASETEAALLKIPGVPAVLDAEARVSEAHVAECLARHVLKTAANRLAGLRARQLQAYDAERRAATAADRLRHHREYQRLGGQIVDADADVRRSRALLADAERKLAAGKAESDMALRAMLR